MEIIWYGHSCFRLRDKDIVVVTDPYDKSLGLPIPRVRADVVTVSHDHPDHNATDTVKGEPVVFNSPGEYEIKGVFITGTSSSHSQERPLEQENTVFVFELDGLTICHLGDLDHVPAQEQIEALGDIHVLLIPVGGSTTINAAQAAEVIRLLEPRIVVPMHYALPEVTLQLDPVSKFFREMGLHESTAESILKVMPSALPEETQVVLMDYKH